MSQQEGERLFSEAAAAIAWAVEHKPSVHSAATATAFHAFSATFGSFWKWVSAGASPLPAVYRSALLQVSFPTECLFSKRPQCSPSILGLSCAASSTDFTSSGRASLLCLLLTSPPLIFVTAALTRMLTAPLLPTTPQPPSMLLPSHIRLLLQATPLATSSHFCSRSMSPWLPHQMASFAVLISFHRSCLIACCT